MLLFTFSSRKHFHLDDKCLKFLTYFKETCTKQDYVGNSIINCLFPLNFKFAYSDLEAKFNLFYIFFLNMNDKQALEDLIHLKLMIYVISLVRMRGVFHSLFKRSLTASGYCSHLYGRLTFGYG